MLSRLFHQTIVKLVPDLCVLARLLNETFATWKPEGLNREARLCVCHVPYLSHGSHAPSGLPAEGAGMKEEGPRPSAHCPLQTGRLLALSGHLYLICPKVLEGLAALISSLYDLPSASPSKQVRIRKAVCQPFRL